MFIEKITGRGHWGWRGTGNNIKTDLENLVLMMP
jgi:hypothetical protein